MKWDDESVEQSDSDYKTLTYLSGIMFANLTGNDDSGEYRDYEFRTSDHVKGLGTILQTYMDDFNTMHSGGVAMDLVFFRDAVSHLARITRILLQPRGNALLVGVGGSGRQSLTRLASFMAGAELRQIEISRAYGMDEWREDIKKALIAAGSGRGHIVFLITDAQVFDDSCLEDVNGILSSGEVLNLYEPDDLENIASAVRSECESYRKHNDISGAPSRDDIIFYFQQRVRERLHIVLAFSPIGTTFRKRMLQYPSFSNCCTIDWFHPWPEDALISVAEKVLSNHVRILGSDDLVAPVSKLCMTLHASVEKAAHQFYVEAGRSYYVTPTSYLELLKLFLSTLLKQRDSVQGNVKRYETGVRLLTETGIKVKELQAELIRLQPEMKQAAIDTEKLLEQLKVDQKLAEETKAEASKAEAAASKLAKSCETQAAECQAELDKAMPAYHKAVKALSKLDKKDISEMKTFTTPPLLVGVTMEAVCLLLGRKQTWADSKKLLGQLNFLDQLKSFDKDGLTPKIIKKLQKFIDREDFTPERVQKQSVAAMSICMWVHAMYTYYTVARTIEPKKLALGKAREQLAEVRKRLKEKQDVLAAVEKKLKELQEQYEASMKKKSDLEQQSKDTKRWLQNATRLDGALGSELGRWSELVTELKSSLLWLVGNVLLSAGMISYGGAFVMSYRTVMENSWKKQCDTQGIAVDPEFSLGRVLGDDVTTRQWRILGLPEDTFSTENGLITTLAGRWPLIIDPQEQGNRWIRNLEADNQLQITTASDSNFLRILENSVRSGLPLLLENVGEQLDSSLEPILLKSIFKRGGEDVIRLGEKVLPYDSNFKLYMTTKLSNPHYLPEVCVKVTLINFGITRRGLEEQLLVDVVRHDRPDLEERKDTLITSIAADRASLGETEDRVLNMLSEATGNILDNEELIVKLEEAKVTSNVVKIRIAEAEETKKEITLAREGYRPAATRGSIIYFVITQLALIDSMYQYSLQFFTKLYTLRLAEVAMSEDLGIRLGNLMEDITASFHSAVCLGLFEKDKQAYALLLATAILQARGDLDNLEWLYFVAGGVGSVGEPDLLMPEAAWVTPFVWASLNSLEKTFPQYFSGLKKHVRKNLPLWETFVSKKGNGRVFNCLPAPWKDTLTPFQSLLLVRALDDTILLPAITEFIGIALGESFRSPPSLDLRKVLATSMCDQPLLFLCSSGADPTNALLQLSRDTECHVRTVSLGQGQGPVAVNHMEHGMRDGDWVLLQNCHLAVSFLPQLEEIVVTKLVSAAGSLHPDFRLWLTSMPTKAFPSSILQAALKMSVQPPRGIRANMLQSFASNVEQSDIDKFVGTAIDIPYRRLIYGLSIFHALALERCKFGGLGWNKPYEWMASDLKTALLMCGIYCESAAEMKTEAAAVAAVPFPALSTMVGAVTYGGRVTDAQDNPTLESILAAFITPNAMADGYEFTSGGGHVHTAPAKLATLEDFSTHVSQLPLFDDPAVFGLHANANISFQRKENRVFMETILQSQSGGTSGDSSQADDGNVTKISLRILSNLEGLEEADAGPDTFEKDDQGGVNAIGVCLKNELIRFNKLTRTIKFTLEELLKALKGLVVMSEGIENMERSMRVQQVPALWAAVAYPSLKPFDGWMQDYFSRIKSFEVWLKQAPPSSFWLSSFFFPQGFVSSVKQTFARKSLVPIDQLDLQTIVTSKTENEALQGVPPNTGVYVHGLYLNGAGFDAEKGEIRHSRPGEIYSEMPVVHLLPYDIAAEATGRLEETYTCPCYKTSLRWGTLSTTGHSTNFVMPYQLKCPPGINAQQLGVALVLQLDM
jgi:dynein heavy chain, axonemal